MAIIIDEERSKVNIVALVGWLSVIGIIIAAIYYLFFVTPDVIVLPTPPELANIAPITSSPVHPEEVSNNPVYTSLKSPSVPMPTPTSPASVGRPNPFISP